MARPRLEGLEDYGYPGMPIGILAGMLGATGLAAAVQAIGVLPFSARAPREVTPDAWTRSDPTAALRDGNRSGTDIHLARAGDSLAPSPGGEYGPNAPISSRVDRVNSGAALRFAIGATAQGDDGGPGLADGPADPLRGGVNAVARPQAPASPVTPATPPHGAAALSASGASMASANAPVAFGAAGFDPPPAPQAPTLTSGTAGPIEHPTAPANPVAPTPGPVPLPTNISSTNPTQPTGSRPTPPAAVGQSPLSFEVNRGQADPGVQYAAQGGGYSLLLSSTAATIELSAPQGGSGAAMDPTGLVAGRLAVGMASSPATPATAAIRLQFIGSDPNAQAQGVDQLPGAVNYLIGRDPAGWHTGIPTYAKVEYANLYPGINLIYYGNQGQLEYDWQVAPGADPGQIRFAVQGADRASLDGWGDLVLTRAGGTVTVKAPTLYQQIGGVRQAVDGRFVLQGAGQVSLAVGSYDHRQPLIIDPVLGYSTLAGSGNPALGIAAGGAGNAYVTGYTSSYTAFVTKLTADGTSAVYTTYLGGGGTTLGTGIAVDALGDAYVSGYTTSTGFPTTAGAYRTQSAGGIDAFVAKLNPAGNGFVYSTLLGGGGTDEASSIALDSSGDAYITGFTTSANYPTLDPLPATTGGSPRAFATEINPSGSGLVYSTYLGGSGSGDGTGIAVDLLGNTYVTGMTTTGGTHVFVTKLTFAAGTLTQAYSATLAGSNTDVPEGIAVDRLGQADVTGYTSSPNFPTLGAIQSTFIGAPASNTHAFVARFSPGGTLNASTFLEGSGSEYGRGIAVDAAGNIAVIGQTTSPDFLTSNSIQGEKAGQSDAFFVELNPAMSAPAFSTFLGGTATDIGTAVALANGSAYLAGYTYADFPTSTGPSAAAGGKPSPFVARLDTLAIVAQDEQFSVVHDQSLPEMDVLANDTGPNPSSLRAVILSGPSSGTLAPNADGTFTYTPNAGYVGPDSFTYEATDGVLTSNPAVVGLTVTDRAPVAANDVFGIDANTTRSIAAPGVLANDTDPDGDTLTASLVSGPTHGSLILNPDGSFTYTAGSGFTGPDSFTYVANDGYVDSNTATVTLNVHATNQPPTAQPDGYSVGHDEALNTDAPGVLANDTDPEGDPLTARLVNGPADGSLDLFSDGSFQYVPDPGFVGADTFTYVANDGLADSGPATVTIRVTDSAPVAQDDAYSVLPGTTLNINASGVLANDTDADGDPLTAHLVAGPADGSLTLGSDGSFDYTPNPGFIGTDTFNYQASDGILDSNTATVTLTVSDTAPVANPDGYGVQANQALTVLSPGVLANDTPGGGPSLTAQEVSGPSHGSLVLDGDGSFTYTPNTGYTGLDSFTYLANDGYLDSQPATVSLVVHAADSPPLAFYSTYQTRADTPMMIDASTGVLATATDADGDPLTAQLVSTVQHGTLSLGADGSFGYTPQDGFVGTDDFHFRAFDGKAYSNPVTVEIDVIDPTPIASAETYTMHAGTPFTADAPGVLQDAFSPSEGDTPLTAVLVSGPADGSLTLNPDGSFTYTPNPTFLGTDTFTYLATDGVLNSQPARVTLNVTDTAPIADAVDAFVAVDGSLSTPAPGVLADAADADGDPLTAVLVSGPADARSFALNPDGSFTYTPQPGFSGTDTFTYEANDGLLTSDPATVTITVSSVPVAVDDYYVYTPGQSLAEPASGGVLANDFDPGASPLTAVLTVGPSSGSLTLNPDGSFVFQPDPSNPEAAATFQYAAMAGGVSSAPATVTIEPDPPQVKLTAVTFRGGSNLINDGSASTSYRRDARFAGPQWLDNNGDGVIDISNKRGANDHAYPYSFASGATMQVTGTFLVADQKVLLKDIQAGKTKVEFRATASNAGNPLNIEFAMAGGKNAALSGVTLSVTLTADAALPKGADFIKSLDLAWEYSVDGGKTWDAAGTSKDPIYVTLNKPTTNALYLTAVAYGSATGASVDDPSKLIDAIWKNFSTFDKKGNPTATRADGQALHYYGDWNQRSFTTASLLSTLNGRCGAWAKFFDVTLLAQGIANSTGNGGLTRAVVEDVTPTNGSLVFLVNNWKIPNAGGTNKFKPDTTPAYPGFPPAPGNQFKFDSEDFTDQPGVPGQNTPNPRSIFGDHAIVLVTTKENGNTLKTYYDPSYGVTYDSLGDLASKSLAAFASVLLKPALGQIWYKIAPAQIINLNPKTDFGAKLRQAPP